VLCNNGFGSISVDEEKPVIEGVVAPTEEGLLGGDSLPGFDQVLAEDLVVNITPLHTEKKGKQKHRNLNCTSC